VLITIALGISVSPRRSAAQMGDVHVDVHGFGTWNYSQTSNDNTFLFGTRDGDYGYVFSALNLSAAVGPQLRMVLQPSWEIDGTGQPTDVSLDLAFIDWRFSDALHLRAGAVKNPFGIYTEIYDVGTLRPFLWLPQSVYGPQGFVSRSYRGVGLTGRRDLPGGWGVSYDAYFGELDITSQNAALDVFVLPSSLALTGEELLPTKTAVGGRVVVQTPLEGLGLGMSAYSGELVAQVARGDTLSRPRTVIGAQASYVNDRLWLRGEFVRGTGRDEEGPRMVVTGGYIEAAFRLTRHWQLAGLFDDEHTALSGVSAAIAPSLLNHRDVEPGLNYWVSRNVVIKLSDHFISGNRFATPVPDALRQVVASGHLRQNTNMVQFGTQFSF
jgi:hypothetical protein